ncbi:MAG: tyrosine--tRNA ligase, partial [Methyloceanibacter sp.]
MSTTKSEFLNELKARGYVHQVTDEAALDKLTRSQRITGYIGFDCTAPSLHVGNLLGIMMLRKLQQAGHRPIVLIGGGTTKVGDPSGKDESRKLLTDAEIAANIGGIESVFGKFVSFGTSGSDAILVNNADWLDQLNYIDFLRDYGRHFSVNRMLSY